jgi:hypothetical protein
MNRAPPTLKERKRSGTLTALRTPSSRKSRRWTLGS